MKIDGPASVIRMIANDSRRPFSGHAKLVIQLPCDVAFVLGDLVIRLFGFGVHCNTAVATGLGSKRSTRAAKQVRCWLPVRGTIDLSMPTSNVDRLTTGNIYQIPLNCGTLGFRDTVELLVA